jgi:DNA-binding transcriptional LysR family regulator
LNNFLSRSALEPRIVLESNSFEMLRHFARSNNAVIFQIKIGTALNRAVDGVIAHAISDTGLEKRNLNVVQLKGRPLSLPAQRFLESVKSSLKAS